jgi:hypothetical protein
MGPLWGNPLLVAELRHRAEPDNKRVRRSSRSK